MEGFLDGSVQVPPKEIDIKVGDKVTNAVNTEYTKWLTQDQQVLSYLLTSMTRDVILQVGAAMTTTDLWATVEEIFPSPTHAKAVNTCIALATTKKGAMTTSEYMAKMKTLANEMAAAGKPLGDKELMSYTLTGLDMEYNPLVTSMLARVEPVPYNKFLSQILSFENRLDLLVLSGGSGSQSPANSASQGGGCGYNNRSTNRGRGQLGGRGRDNGGRGRDYNAPNRDGGQKPRFNAWCQVCMKEGHSAIMCWHRFVSDYVPDERNANCRPQLWCQQQLVH